MNIVIPEQKASQARKGTLQKSLPRTPLSDLEGETGMKPDFDYKDGPF